MNIAYLTTEYPAVSHTFIRREILELEKRGHSIHRFSIRKAKNVIDKIDVSEQKTTFYCLAQPKLNIASDFLKVFLFNPLKGLAAIKLMISLYNRSERGFINHCAYLVEAAVVARELQRRNVNHVHVHFGTNSTAVALLVKALSNITYSFTVHGPDEFDAAIGFSLDRKIENSQFVVAISNYGAAQLKRWVEYKYWSKIHVVRCTVDSNFLNENIEEIKESNTLVCVGRLSAQKGQILLLEALRKVKDKNIDIKLVLVGDGEMRPILEERIKALDLTDDVSITGWATGQQVKKYLINSRGLVLPSFAEGLPVVIMEAFALARPVITTSIAGIPELVNTQNGWLITPNNIDALIESMAAIGQSPIAKLNEMGRQGREDVEKMHYVVNEVSKLENLLLKMD